MAQLADVVAAGIRTGRGGMALTVLEGLTVLVDGALLQAMAEAPGSPCGADTGAGGPGPWPARVGVWRGSKAPRPSPRLMRERSGSFLAGEAEPAGGSRGACSHRVARRDSLTDRGWA
jgi:hypothetical protein